MPVFTPPALITDQPTIAANAKAFLEAELPGWQPGVLEELLIDAFSFNAAEQAEVLKAELVNAFKGLGPLINTNPIEAQPATGTATFTLSAAAPEGGFLIAQGTVIGLRDANNDLQGFRLVADLIVEAGKTTASGLVEAVEVGAAGNGLSGACELISTPAGVLSAVLGITANGLDEEEESVFLDRLTEALALQKPGPVLAADAAVIARSVPGVFRATAVDNLKPAAADGGEGAEETNVEKCVTVACTDINGVASTAEVLAEVKALLQSLREQNFEFFVVKPHYTKIDVTTTVSAWPGQNLATVKAEVLAAIERFLSPARWGTDLSGNPERWANDPIVRQSELFTAVASVPGVRWCSALTFAKHGEGLGTANVTLGSGSAVPALPEVTGSTFNITVLAS